MNETSDEIKRVRRLARRSSVVRGELERAVLDAVRAGYSQRLIAQAAGFASHRSVAQIIERRKEADG